MTKPWPIVVITACWKRPEVFRVFLQNMAALKPAPVVVCAGSPGDGCEQLAREFGVVYEQVPNQLATKWNHAIAMGLQVPAAYYLLMGADDLMDQRCWNYYQRYRGQHLALLDYYFFNPAAKQTLHWPGYTTVLRKGEPIGAAKLLRADVLRMIHPPFDVRRPMALDFDMHRRVRSLAVRVDVVPMKETGGISLDVKTAHNLTPWSTIKAQPGMRKADLRTLSPQLWKLTSTLRR